MELLLTQSEPSPGKQICFWKNPAAWLQEKNLGSGYWVFFMAAFFFDAGFAIYAFLFNLYLLDLHFNERAMGLIVRWFNDTRLPRRNLACRRAGTEVWSATAADLLLCGRFATAGAPSDMDVATWHS